MSRYLVAALLSGTIYLTGYYAEPYLRQTRQQQPLHLLIAGLVTLVIAVALPVWLGVTGGAEMLVLALFVNALGLVMRRARRTDKNKHH